MFCTKCGEEIKPGNIFCFKCGAYFAPIASPLVDKKAEIKDDNKDTKQCCDCVYREIMDICGKNKSQFYGRKIAKTDKCEFYAENKGSIHFNRGLLFFINNEIERAKTELERALFYGLNYDDEVIARIFLGNTIFSYELLDEGIEEIDKALKLDESKKLNILKTNRLQRLSALGQFDFACVYKSRLILGESGIDAAIQFIREKLHLVDYLEGKYFPALTYELSTLIVKKADISRESGQDFKPYLRVALKLLNDCLEAEYDVEREGYKEYREWANNAIRDLRIEV